VYGLQAIGTMKVCGCSDRLRAALAAAGCLRDAA